MTNKFDSINTDFTQLNRDVIRGTSNEKIIWQPRILCWYYDRIFSGEGLPEPYTGMSLSELYRQLKCSNRIYEYSACIQRIDDQRVFRYINKVTKYESEYVIETPVGKISTILRTNSSNGGEYPSKWLITCENDMKVAAWVEEHTEWKWNQDAYERVEAVWGKLGLPTIFFPRVNVQNLLVETMGVQEAIYSIYDYPNTVDKYFRSLHENQERFIDVVNSSCIEVINFGDNIHGNVLPPELFAKYVLPEYQWRNEKLHQANKFTNSHWDGDVKPLLKFAKECGLDGIEAITPKPQGDVTIEEMKEALGDEIFLMDGIAAILFDDMYPEKQLIEQTKRIIELFAPKLILGISDEMSSTGNIERVKLVGSIVDEYNASLN